MKNETPLQTPSSSTLGDILQTIRDARHIVLLTHQGPDGDGLGAMFGLYHTLSSPNHILIPATESRPGPAFTCIPQISHLTHNPQLKDADLFITLDAGEPDRIEFYHTSYKSRTINIDHHPSDRFAMLNYLDTSVSSTSEIISAMFFEHKIHVPPQAATALLAGIFFDTGGFQHNTSSTTLHYVAKLLRYGGDLERVTSYLKHSTTPQALNIWGQALEDLSLEQSPALAHTHIPHSVLKSFNLSSKDLQLDKLALLIGTISESSFGLLATEYEDGNLKGSFRTDSFKNVNVEQIAKYLGGGGHRYAAGFRYKGSYTALIADIRKAWHNGKSDTEIGSVAE